MAWTDDAACSAASLTDACEQCAETVSAMTFSVVMSVATQVVQMATDLQRTTPYGEAACQECHIGW